jgi:hypothetical protein
MPILTLSLTGADNVITLDHEIKAQKLVLKYYQIVFNGNSYTDTAIWVDITDGGSHWLSHDTMNGVEGANPNGMFLLPVHNKASHDRVQTIYPDISISASSHIPKSFTVSLYEADGLTKITSSHLTSLRLVFQYESHKY